MLETWWEKKSKEQTLEELTSAHRRSQAKCQLVQTSYIKRIKWSLFSPCNNILLTELSRSVWENLDRGRVYRSHCVRSVLTTLVKILPYRPPTRLIRAKYKPKYTFCNIYYRKLLYYNTTVTPIFFLYKFFFNCCNILFVFNKI